MGFRVVWLCVSCRVACQVALCAACCVVVPICGGAAPHICTAVKWTVTLLLYGCEQGSLLT